VAQAPSVPVPASAVVAPPVAPPVAAPAPPPAPFKIVTVMQDIVRHADPVLGVNTLADKSVLNIGSDRLQFRLKSSEAGYVYVFFAGTDKQHMYLLFPNGIDKNNRIEINKEMLLPRKGWQITAGGPPGVNHIVTMVSRQPRDLSGSGLKTAGEEIPEFDLAAAEQLWLARTGPDNPLVGKPVCEGAGPCDGSYGATLLTIEEVAKAR
jgi:hypothetical protein